MCSLASTFIDNIISLLRFFCLLVRLIFFLFPEKLNNTELLVSAHEKLGEVLRILRGILQKYCPIQSSELLLSASGLIQNIRNYNYEDSDLSLENNSQVIYDAIDQLALAFSSR